MSKFNKTFYQLLSFKLYIFHPENKKVLTFDKCDFKKERYYLPISRFCDILLGFSYDGMKIGDKIEIFFNDCSYNNIMTITDVPIQPFIFGYPLLWLLTPYHEISINVVLILLFTD